MRIASVTMFAFALFAATGASASESYAFGNRVLTVGDSAGKLIELAGSPVHKEPVENKFGAHEAERWEFRREEKTLFFTIRDGKVAQIDEVY